jgi:hypothetical protein
VNFLRVIVAVALMAHFGCQSHPNGIRDNSPTASNNPEQPAGTCLSSADCEVADQICDGGNCIAQTPRPPPAAPPSSPRIPTPPEESPPLSEPSPPAVPTPIPPAPPRPDACSARHDPCGALGKICDATTHFCRDCSASNECGVGKVCSSGLCTTASSAPPAPPRPVPPALPPTPPATGSAQLGQACNAATCASGLFCAGSGSQKFCSRLCIGSGKGGNNDCPSGYACTSAVQDGIKLCVAAAQLPADEPGQPFNKLPGISCPDGTGCQTGVCLQDGTCARACQAARDCRIAEVCWTGWTDSHNMTAERFCFPTDTINYTPTGDTCSSGEECDTGNCAGSCDGDGTTLCNSNSDCAGGSTCSGVCVKSCRANRDCASSEACSPWATQVQVDFGYIAVCLGKEGTGTAALGTSCTTYSTCKSDWCMGGICTTPCALNDDCTGNLSTKTCQIQSFSSGRGMPFCL